MLEIEELEEVLSNIYEKLVKEITTANRTSEEELNRVLEKYGFVKEEDNYYYIDLRNSKVLVVGQMNIKIKDIIGLCKSIGFDADRLDYVSYDEATNYNFENLRYSNRYSDVIIGPTPHKGKGIAEHSSIITFLESNKLEFPNIIRAEDGNGLNLNKNTLKQALLQTRIMTNETY